ncbi:MAG: holo-ACP synthase [Ignavibacteriales bacterium]|nr:holo-ACP synthase [Ignavibacteriales bacterium]
MVEGVGVDVVEISRFKKSIDEFGEHFLNKIFTDKERAYADSKMYQVQHLAARFAVKEAVAKALAKGWSGGFKWKDVEVENDDAGKPSVILYGHVKEILSGSNVLVSISHSENVVIAFAIIEKR